MPDMRQPSDRDAPRCTAVPRIGGPTIRQSLVAACALLGSAVSADADTLIAVRPGAMCTSPAALAILTMPDGSDRAAGPHTTPGLLNIRQDGGCIDIPLGARVTVQSVRRRTSIVTFDAGDGHGARSFIVPNIDFETQTAGSPMPGVPSPAPSQAADNPGALPAPALATPAPAATGTPSPVPDAPSSPAPYAVPATRDYAGIVVAMIKQTPSLASNEQLVRWWASYRYPRDWNALQNQEFRLQPLLAQARADLATTVAATPAGTLAVLAQARFGEYDFARSTFPLQLGFDQLELDQPCCFTSDALPRSVTLTLSGLKGVDSLPMQQAEAQAFVEKRTRFGSVDRQLLVLLTVTLDPPGVATTADGRSQASGTVGAIDVLSGPRDPQLVYRFTGSALAALDQAQRERDAQSAKLAADRQRQAERDRQEQVAQAQAAAAAQQAALQRQQLLGQRQQLVAELSQAPVSVRLASFVSPGIGVSAAPLDNLRAARTRALLAGEPSAVTMMVQAAGTGRDVPTSWPGHLEMVVSSGRPLVSGGWYLVSGRLDVPPGNDLPAARLDADAVFACASAACADAAQPDVIVSHKLAAVAAP